MGGYQRRRSNVDGALASVDFEDNLSVAVGVLALQWLLFDFGERDALTEAADQGLVVAGIGFTAAHQQLIESVSLAYYSHAAARARLGVARRSLVNSRGALKAAEAKYRQGVGTVVEVAQARQGVAQAELAHVQAEGLARDREQTLIAALGISPLVRLKIADAPEPQVDNAMMAPLDRLVSDALARRPDVQAAHAALLAGQAGVKAAEASQRPKVFVAASVGSSSSNANLGATLPGIGLQAPPLNLAGSGTGTGAFVGISVPIFDGG